MLFRVVASQLLGASEVGAAVTGIEPRLVLTYHTVTGVNRCCTTVRRRFVTIFDLNNGACLAVIQVVHNFIKHVFTDLARDSTFCLDVSPLVDHCELFCRLSNLRVVSRCRKDKSMWTPLPCIHCSEVSVPSAPIPDNLLLLRDRVVTAGNFIRCRHEAFAAFMQQSHSLSLHLHF